MQSKKDNNGVLCSKWDSVCFVLLANTWLVVVAIHQYRASKEGLVALSFQSLEVSAESVPLLLLSFCQPVLKPKTALTQLFRQLQKFVLDFY